MGRSMWIIVAIIAVMAIAMIYQSEVGGGIERPWAQCKESLVQQVFSNACTPRGGSNDGLSLEPAND
jgi:hypothetical protein